MKPTCSCTIFLILLIISSSFDSAILAGDEVAVGSRYDISSDKVELRAGPSLKDERIVNQKASAVLKKIHYLTVDTSTTVKVTEIKNDWAKIEVVEPAYLAESHRGWIPLHSIKIGDATLKKGGWVRQKSDVFTSKDTNSKPIGYLVQRASISIADDGSGWLRLIQGPVRDAHTNKFLEHANTPKVLYIEAKNFTDITPAEW